MVLVDLSFVVEIKWMWYQNMWPSKKNVILISIFMKLVHWMWSHKTKKTLQACETLVFETGRWDQNNAIYFCLVNNYLYELKHVLVLYKEYTQNITPHNRWCIQKFACTTELLVNHTPILLCFSRKGKWHIMKLQWVKQIVYFWAWKIC